MRWLSMNRTSANERGRIRAGVRRRDLPEEVRKIRRESARRNRSTSREYVKRRRLSDYEFRLVSNIRTRVVHALRGRGVKSARTLELLGCSPQFLWQHLESQFIGEMARENYGVLWHVDHKKPCSWFDLTRPEQQRACFHFSNLQPLLAFDNLSKKNLFESV